MPKGLNKEIVRDYAKKVRKERRTDRYEMDSPRNAPKYCKYEDPRVCRHEFAGLTHTDDKEYLRNVHHAQKVLRLTHTGIII
jgi:hypothetical protein